ncbi:hypothetical protein [Pinirhizobacter soli]|uniref:hypothetical protein n=1 Tax=Pinirhizobacter soli TaxID=2786953 RepID=UPI00202A7231|nr:hypothetical protein [Pinirhizobacter soli]
MKISRTGIGAAILTVSLLGLQSCSSDSLPESACFHDDQALVANGPSRMSARMATDFCDDLGGSQFNSIYLIDQRGGRIDVLRYEPTSISADPVVSWQSDGSVEIVLNQVNHFEKTPPTPGIEVHLKVVENRSKGGVGRPPSK